MIALTIHHRVRDVAAWQPRFAAHAAVRRRHGAMSDRVYRSLDDPGDLLVVISFPTRAGAEAFLADPSLPEAMAQAGVDGPPTVTLREEVDPQSDDTAHA